MNAFEGGVNKAVPWHQGSYCASRRTRGVSGARRRCGGGCDCAVRLLTRRMIMEGREVTNRFRNVPGEICIQRPGLRVEERLGDSSDVCGEGCGKW